MPRSWTRWTLATVTGHWPPSRPISTPSSRPSSGSPGSIAAISSTEGTSMAVIERVEIRMVDLQPKVKRSDAIQSFVSQETPFVRIWDSDGAVGTGYSYTIGSGGHAMVELLA